MWFIIVGKGMEVEIEFLGFDLTHEISSCISYLKIRSSGGFYVNHYNYGQGSQLPPRFKSNSSVEVIFRTGGNKDQNSGFLLKYMIYEESKVSTASTNSVMAATLNETGMQIIVIYAIQKALHKNI